MYVYFYNVCACLYNSSLGYHTYFKQLNDQLLLIARHQFRLYIYIHAPSSM